MALYFETNTPQNLLNAFKKAIDDGKIATWSYDTDGDFTHTADQWKYKAWLRPKIVDGQRLSLFIIPPKNSNISVEVYAIYHGRFIESILAHCDKFFKKGIATSFPEGEDNVFHT